MSRWSCGTIKSKIIIRSYSFIIMSMVISNQQPVLFSCLKIDYKIKLIFKRIITNVFFYFRRLFERREWSVDNKYTISSLIEALYWGQKIATVLKNRFGSRKKVRAWFLRSLVTPKWTKEIDEHNLSTL